MAHKIEDRWLWLGLGVFTFAAVKGVAYGLREIRHLTKVRNGPPKPHIPISLGKEDAIKTSSLATLATCSNVEIRKAATKILCDRFITSPSAYRLLQKDLHSRDPDTRHRAEQAIALLLEHDTTGIFNFPPNFPPSTPQALRRNENRDPIERDLRRRRREAMVINEGDRPLSQRNVWMRDRDGRMSTEEEMRPADFLVELTGDQE